MSTRWFPDTCECVLVYDSQEPSGKLSVVTIEHACALHTGAGTSAQQWTRKRAQTHLETVLEHNRGHKRLENGQVVPRDQED